MSIEVALNLKGLGHREKITEYRDVIAKMTGNANTPAPTPTLVVFGEHVDTAEGLLNQISTLEGQLDTLRIQRDAAFVVTDGDYSTNGSYVENRAKLANDPSIVTGAGYELAAARGNAQPMPMVTGLGVTTGDNEGSADVQWNGIKGAKSYEVQITTNPNDPASWVHECTCTASFHHLTGKTPGQKIWVRVRAVNKLGPGAWSDPAAGTIH
jgi:hypothetical protein